LTLTRTSASGTSANLSAIKLLSYRWGNQGRGGEYEYPYNWDASQNIYPRVSNASSLGLASNKWSNVYATTFTGDLEGNAKTATSANSAKSDAAGNEISTTYAPLASPTFTGTPSAPTAAAGTNTTQIATTAFVNNAVGAGFAANDAMLFKGTIGTGGTVTALPNTHSIGWTYRVITAGTYAGQSCEIGDLIICIADGTAANNAHWTIAQGNISNMSTVVAGPSSATSGNFPVFDGTTGKKIKDSGVSPSTYLPKVTYEYNKELSLSSNGKVCIGKFPMYDSNITVDISSTTTDTYHGTLVIASQNINTTGGGTYKAVVYGDATNTITPAIRIEYLSGSNVFSVYANLPGWSKNFIHIKFISSKGAPTTIVELATAIPDTATIIPINALTTNFLGKSDITVTNTLATGSKIATVNIGGTAKDIFQTPLTWDNISNKPTSFAPSDHTHAYLPLTGGTVTGPIEFNTGTLNNNYNEGVRITAAANNWAGITFGSTGLAGAPTNGWFAAKNPSGQFIITPENSSNTTGLTLTKNGEALWRNNKIYHAGNLTALKNPNALTIFNNNYDGSSAVTVNTISADVLT
jgi:hypothetical protein